MTNDFPSATGEEIQRLVRRTQPLLFPTFQSPSLSPTGYVLGYDVRYRRGDLRYPVQAIGYDQPSWHRSAFCERWLIQRLARRLHFLRADSIPLLVNRNAHVSKRCASFCGGGSARRGERSACLQQFVRTFLHRSLGVTSKLLRGRSKLATSW